MTKDDLKKNAVEEWEEIPRPAEAREW